ncbi:hypothetical protein TL16_g11666 [Triparma laevis f. inornata]|uniref:BD-FAE-like domain-containing protein n=1 Tax=Triparma laevis f. inornata TaxID=1714386 RepID=A0A9W7EUA0_9STRA|nr:hypothetical protein TL16_g11666 [Triparma laevis f. inornata]
MSDNEPDAPLNERHRHDATVPPGAPPAPETKKTHHKHKHHDKTKHKQKHKQKEKREHEEHKDAEDNYDQDHYVEPSASSLECVCCVNKPKLLPGKLDKETGQITYTKRVWSRCCCCLFPTNRALEVMLMTFLVLNAVTCVSYTVPSFFAVAVAQNILAPTFLLISLIYVIVLLGLMTKAKLTKMPQRRFNVVMAMLGMGCVIFYISPLIANHGVALNLPKNLETSFPNYFSSQSTLPPSPQSQPFAFTDWLNNFKSFRGLTPNPPHSLANVTTLPFKTVVDKEVRDCTSMSREWDPQLFMQIYRPTYKFSVSPSPVIFHIHGGGWKVGDMSWTGWSFSYFLERGYTIVSSQYSLTCYGYTGQEMRDDLEDAYNFLATKETEWDLDMSRVTAVGESAGGHLVTWLAYTLPGAFNAVFNVYGPVNFELWETIPYRHRLKPGGGDMPCSDGRMSTLFDLTGGNCTKAAYRSISATNYVEAGTPPTMTIHGAQDSLVPIVLSEDLHERLDRAGVENLLIKIEAVDHGMDYGYNGLPGQLLRYSFERLLGGGMAEGDGGAYTGFIGVWLVFGFWVCLGTW